MNTCDSSIFDGKISVGLEQTLENVMHQTGRKLNPLEESIISLLHAKCTNRFNHRFTVNGKNGLLACETDAQAGIIDLTEDYACTFRTEPAYSGTVKEIAGKLADASGKIYREISICGGQPLATLLSLSTSVADNAPAQAELQNAVTGMASYNNTFGIPVIGGDIRFHDSEQRGITANLLSIGLIDKEAQLGTSCQGTGNPVYLVGPPDAGEKQISSGAFITRSLYELICDLHDAGAIVAIQSIDSGGTGFSGAAELIAATCADMVANGTNGIELNVKLFDGEQKLTELIPNKLMMIVKENCGKKLEKSCHKWNMRCLQVGVVTDEHKLVVIKDKTPLVDLPASVLSMFYGALPENIIDSLPADSVASSSADVPLPEEHKDVANFMITCPNLLSQQWFFDQFDSTVGTNNLSTNFITDTPVLQIKGARQALAVSFCQSDTNIAEYPESVNLTVAESLRKAVCSGGEPCVLTGCLNYIGNVDEKILHTINEHIALFCKKTGISSSGIYMNRIAVKGKPAIHNLSTGVIAFLNDKHQQMTMSFKGKGDMIYMLGKSGSSLDSSEYIRNYHGIKGTPPQHIDLDMEAKLLLVAQKIIARKLVKSAHSVSKGGLFMALLESAMVRSFGFDITVDDEIRKDAFLFGESPSRIVVSVGIARETAFIDFMMKSGVPFMALGHVTREEIRIDDNSYGFISDYRKKYFRE
jgi:phosphoribosylformylglycinamidine synthase